MKLIGSIRDWWNRSIFTKILSASIVILLFALSFLGYFSLSAGQSGIRRWVAHYNSNLAILTARAIDTGFNVVWNSFRGLAQILEASSDLPALEQARVMSEIRPSTSLAHRRLYLLADEDAALVYMADQNGTLREMRWMELAIP